MESARRLGLVQYHGTHCQTQRRYQTLSNGRSESIGVSSMGVLRLISWFQCPPLLLACALLLIAALLTNIVDNNINIIDKINFANVENNRFRDDSHQTHGNGRGRLSIISILLANAGEITAVAGEAESINADDGGADVDDGEDPLNTQKLSQLRTNLAVFLPYLRYYGLIRHQSPLFDYE
jgi:hypothetical protein